MFLAVGVTPLIEEGIPNCSRFLSLSSNKVGINLKMNSLKKESPPPVPVSLPNPLDAAI